MIQSAVWDEPPGLEAAGRGDHAVTSGGESGGVPVPDTSGPPEAGDVDALFKCETFMINEVRCVARGRRRGGGGFVMPSWARGRHHAL